MIAPGGKSPKLVIIFLFATPPSPAPSSLAPPRSFSFPSFTRPGQSYLHLFTAKQSLLSSLSPTTKISHLGGSFVGTSLSEWTIQSISPARSEVSRSAVQSDFPWEARVWRGVDLSVSPIRERKWRSVLHFS